MACSGDDSSRSFMQLIAIFSCDLKFDIIIHNLRMYLYQFSNHETLIKIYTKKHPRKKLDN